MSKVATDTGGHANVAWPDMPGLRFRRPILPADWAPLAQLIADAALHDGIQEILSADELRVEWESSDGLEPARDVVLVERAGQLVAYVAGSLALRDDVLVGTVMGTVAPPSRGVGIGTALLAWIEAHLSQRLAADPRPNRRELRAYATESQIGWQALLACRGYAAIRYMFEMRGDLRASFDRPRLPPGIELRSVSPEHHRAIFEADDDAFQDHWGHRLATDGDFARMFGAPGTDTSLWRIAWDGGQVAGVAINRIYAEENEQLGLRRGWLDRISVRRPWRGRGLGRALVVASLGALREKGLDEAMLGVDAENPTGALRLYESTGFEVAKRWFVLAKPIADVQGRSR